MMEFPSYKNSILTVIDYVLSKFPYVVNSRVKLLVSKIVY